MYSSGGPVGSFLGRRGEGVPLAIVHHGNQYLITEGYNNRPGLADTLGSTRDRTGLAGILELHRVYNIPANVHVSGTLLEAIAWHQPSFLDTLREIYDQGLIEFVGSCYGQNLMRFFAHDYNLRQLNEQLQLYRLHLGLDPAQVRVFWPPERVWETERMAAVLRDRRLLNQGYQYVIVDDRLLLPTEGNPSPRHCYDQTQNWDPQLFKAYPMEDGQGLIALPIASNLRQSIPPRQPNHWNNISSQLRFLSGLDPDSYDADLIAIYGDDMEKPAGVRPWDSEGPAQFEALLRWVSENPWIRPVKLTEWGSASRIAGTRVIEAGTYLELANHFNAGEKYEKWYFDPQWEQYREQFAWSENRVDQLASLGADPALIALAQKHLLVSSWETAWHTPGVGAHGAPAAGGHPSPWIKAVASHSRHAAVIAEASYWMKHKDGEAHAYLQDIDADGDHELVLKNDKLFAILTPRWGGRLVYLFSVEGEEGKLLIGNPCDDWNWMEELNKFMDVPRNHPGALADIGFEHDPHEPTIILAQGPAAHARLWNKQPDSAAHDLAKDVLLSSYESNVLTVDYTLPAALSGISVEFGLSPDYLNLLRRGRSILKSYDCAGVRGWTTETTAVWVKPEHCTSFQWSKPSQEEFGHGRAIRLSVAERQFRVSVGVETHRPNQTGG
jgi:hypothetical protein